MKTQVILAISLLAFLASGCKKDNGGTTPPPQQEDWTFPADTANAIKLYSEKDSITVGQSFDVKVILYNVTGIFGTAVEVVYTSANVQVTSVLAGPLFAPAANTLTVSNINATRNTASFGVTYKAGTGGSVTGSGVVFKLKCTATAAGMATFAIDPATLEVRKTDNTIANPPIGPALNVTVH